MYILCMSFRQEKIRGDEVEVVLLIVVNDLFNFTPRNFKAFHFSLDYRHQPESNK